MITEEIKSPAMIDMLPCGIISVSDEGIIQFINGHLCELLGYEKDELLQKSIDNILTVSGRIFYQTHFFPLVKLNNKADEIFFHLKTKNNNSIPVIASAKREGNITYCVFVTVWQRKQYENEILEAKRLAEHAIEKNDTLNRLKEQAEQQLAESDRQLSQLTRINKEYIQLSKIISHDVHEPIRKLLVYIDMLLAGNTDDKSIQADRLGKMMEFTHRLRKLTMCLQQYVAIDVNKEPISDIDITSLAKECFEQTIKEYGIEDATLHIDPLPLHEGYRSQLKRLLTEIFSNSCKFRKQDEPLTITISGVEFNNNIYKELKDKYRYINFLRVEIEDNGIGFPDEHKEYIFGLFNKAHLEYEGAGFGLALCRKIVEKHNGSITARSNASGTVITIQLPIKQNVF